MLAPSCLLVSPAPARRVVCRRFYSRFRSVLVLMLCKHFTLITFWKVLCRTLEITHFHNVIFDGEGLDCYQDPLFNFAYYSWSRLEEKGRNSGNFGPDGIWVILLLQSQTAWLCTKAPRDDLRWIWVHGAAVLGMWGWILATRSPESLTNAF